MSLSVVVVDDTSEFRAIVRFIMATASETMTLVGEAADGEEALALILGERPAFVITDILMPRMNGIQLLRRSYRRLALMGGADAFLNKSVLARDLLPTIREILAVPEIC